MPPNGTSDCTALLGETTTPKSMTMRKAADLASSSKPSSSSSLSIKLLDFSAKLEATSSSMRITEGPQSFLLPSPTFRSRAAFEVHGVDEHTHLTVGFVQVMTARHFRLVYSHGHAEWELDGGTSDTAVSDSDGRRVPFFGMDDEIVTIKKTKGTDSKKTVYRVEMADQPMAKIPWKLDKARMPESTLKKTEDEEVTLRFVDRRQTFRTWLAVHDHTRQLIIPVVALDWEIDLTVDVDSTRPIGKRTSWRPMQVRNPRALTNTPPVPWAAVDTTKTCRTLDKLTWHCPQSSRSSVIVPAAHHLRRRLTTKQSQDLPEKKPSTVTSTPISSQPTRRMVPHAGKMVKQIQTGGGGGQGHVVTKAIENVKKSLAYARRVTFACLFNADQ